MFVRVDGFRAQRNASTEVSTCCTDGASSQCVANFGGAFVFLRVNMWDPNGTRAVVIVHSSFVACQAFVCCIIICFRCVFTAPMVHIQHLFKTRFRCFLFWFRCVFAVSFFVRCTFPVSLFVSLCVSSCIFCFFYFNFVLSSLLCLAARYHSQVCFSRGALPVSPFFRGRCRFQFSLSPLHVSSSGCCSRCPFPVSRFVVVARFQFQFLFVVSFQFQQCFGARFQVRHFFARSQFLPFCALPVSTFFICSSRFHFDSFVVACFCLAFPHVFTFCCFVHSALETFSSNTETSTSVFV